MKKNKFLKIASAMIVLCLITTCVIGTTLAKYTTGGSTNDSARIAKWGVILDIDGESMFKNEYSNTANSVTVKSSDDVNVVAPGTSSADHETAATFSISGTPEVACKVDIVFKGTDIVLPAGTYDDYTTEAEGDTFTLDADYNPVVFTLKQTDSATGKVMNEISGTLATIKAALDAYTASAIYAPNTVLDATFELSWAWAFEGNDKADTYLANVMAGIIEDENAVLETSYSVSITVTQID